MPEINVQTAVGLPPVSLEAVLHESLESIRTLHVELRDLGFPDVGYVAVPIHMEIGAPRSETPNVYPLSIRAERAENFFPEFTGQAGADANGPSASIVWIAGEYSAPLGAAGALIDQTLLSRVAQHAMQNLLNDLSSQAAERGKHRELENARSRMMRE